MAARGGSSCLPSRQYGLEGRALARTTGNLREPCVSVRVTQAGQVKWPALGHQ